MLNSSVVKLVDLNPEKFELWLHNLTCVVLPVCIKQMKEYPSDFLLIDSVFLIFRPSLYFWFFIFVGTFLIVFWKFSLHLFLN